MLSYQTPAIKTVPLLVTGGSLVWFGWISIVRTICTYAVIPVYV